MCSSDLPYLTDADKCYEAEVVLGTTTTTEDATGEPLVEKPVEVTKAQIEAVVASFIGTYTQTPPMYSAIKVNGVRLYELARQGLVVDRPSREVYIKSCDIIEWIDEKRFRIRVNCSKGTYIRTLCTDIGEALGCGAHMGYLLRTRVGAFKLEDSLTLEELEAHKADLSPYLQDLRVLFKAFPILEVTTGGEKRLYNGNPLYKQDLSQVINGIQDQDIVQIYDTKKQFIGLYKWVQESNCFKVEKMFYNA